VSPIIRAYGAYDFDDVYGIYARTAETAVSGVGRHSGGAVDPDLVVAPYVVFEPELAFVVDDDDDSVAGYVLATADTRQFVERVRTEWMPRLSNRHRHGPAVPLVPSERRVLPGADPERLLVNELDAYPAHFQINVLPNMRGRGVGRMLIDSVRMALRARDVPGMHVTLDPNNDRLAGFYHRLGFMPLRSTPTAFGIRTVD
jgi:ribosomal protein S18 acetylase RimI-like enzyme